ncbi:MAG: hypothetical protein FWH20_03520 [Oscillospiraceae bacterium]|nr:hypothetical protein [Oscillospiraceae bacterium]
MSSSSNFIGLIIVGILLASALAVILSTIWVYKDAKAKGLPAGLWALLVVGSGGFLGLILYILIARKQNNVICGHCNKQTSEGVFCSRCGNQLSQADLSNGPSKTKAGHGLLIACIPCFAVVLILYAVMMISIFFPSGGFMYSYTSGQYQYSFSDNATGKGISQKSSGNYWQMSFKEATAGYTFSNYYAAKASPSSIEVSVNYSNTVHFIVSQGNTKIDEMLTDGDYEFDMSDFTTGRINIKIINIHDGTNYSGSVTINP